MIFPTEAGSHLPVWRPVALEEEECWIRHRHLKGLRVMCPDALEMRL